MLSLFLAASLQFNHEPIETYAQKRIHGFTIRISKAAQNDPNALVPALEAMEAQLQLVVDAVPPKALEVLRTIPIFLENANPQFPCACYHPSAEWLKQNGYIAQKRRSVEISNIKNFVVWIKQQPYMVLHELAHGYHDVKFGYADPYIGACLKSVVKRGIYEKVERYNGRMERHYALNNQQEYFAETTEAYFGKNDYWPFDREQLEQTDPQGAAMIRWAWGMK